MSEMEKLIKMARDGDIDAFDVIIRRFRDMAVGYAYSILGDFHLAEDAAQEAFVQAYRNLGQLRLPAAFPSWFRRIVFKHCDRITRRKRHSTVSFEKTAEPADSSRTPDELIRKKEERDFILDKIKALPDQERTATTLFYINGYSLLEVGDFLETPVNTVKSSLYSARKKLREEMVDMVKNTLKDRSPGKDFNDRIRKVLEEVPQVSFVLHRKKDQSGMMRCPESMPFPSCLRACLEYLEEDMGGRTITAYGRDWRLDTTYVFLMGTTGSAFRLSWKPEWYLGNPDITLIADEPLAPYRRGMESLGYAYELLERQTPGMTEKKFAGRIMDSIRGKGRPVIANGVVGPPTDCLITGFDEGGEVLVGWSFFQGEKEFSADLEFEPDGGFRKRNWFENTHRIILLGEKRENPPLERVYRDTLQWVLEIARATSVRGECLSGPAAYEAWAGKIEDEAEFLNKKVKDLHFRYLVHQDATGMIAEGRWYAGLFLRQMMEDVSCPEDELSRAAECYNGQHDLIWKMWSLVGGPGASVGKAKLFRESDVRKKTAAFIREAKDLDRRAADHIEKALKNWA